MTNETDLRARPIESKRDFEAFFRLPWKIYRDDPMWVPPIRSSARAEFIRGKNPFLDHCDFQLFILERGAETIGRVAAMVDHLANEAWGAKIGMFAYFECPIDESEGARLLLDAARGWIKAQGMDTMRGPWSFVSQEWGLVVEGFEPEPVIMAPYNPREYEALIEDYGLRKVKDLRCWSFSMPDGYRIPDRILTLTDSVAERYKITMRTIDFSRFHEEVELFGKLSQSSLRDNWGISPITDDEIEDMAKQLRPIVSKECVLFARNEKGEDIGFALSIPDINVILKKIRGRMLPFGWLRLLWGIPRLRHYRMFALGVAEAYQGKGVDALLYREMWERMAVPELTMEVNYVLEDNAPMVNAITKLGATPSRLYRIYQMPI